MSRLSSGRRGLGRVLLTLALLLIPLGTAAAKPEPGARGRTGFRLFARPLGALTVNRVYCGLDATGQVCVDSLGSSTIGGGFWPKGTADQYVFNSGLQIAGIVGNDGGPWANDTTGAFFFDPKGTTLHGEQVQPIYNTQSQADNAFICGIGSFGCNAGTTDPAALAARVPSGDANETVFNALLRGRTAASQGDVWWLSWDGNPGLVAGRPHPLGVVVEQRGMAWNFPAGNEDIAYFIYTFYNITTTNPAAYAAVRPGMRDILIQQANSFQQRNEATFGIDLPDAGYTINSMFANFSADMDVANAGVNFSSVNVPFALGYVYDHTFSRFPGWEFDPAIFSAPFFAGSGFVGVKYLKSPEIAPGVEAGLTLFSNTINPSAGVPGSVPDPANTTQLYRYISGNQSTAAGDAPCNFNPITTHICYINGTQETDMRFIQSSGPLTLGPGEFGSVVVAYIFAAPVAVGGTAGCPACDITPGAPAIIAGLGDPAVVSLGVNTVDSITGFLDANDADLSGTLSQDEFTVVPGSLLGKALVAQAVFDGGFLLPFAPDPPDFFLIPGDNQVTVMWRPTPSETNGDPYFALASQPTVGGNPNVLYDPNYRQFDVEGYRVYRGRVDSPNQLRLLAQFDYAGTVITDFAGQVGSPTLDALCAPELGVNANCPVAFDPVSPGVPRTVGVDIPLVGQIIQVKLGERTLLADSTAIVLIADTTVSGRGTTGSCAPSVCPLLVDNGVPFTYVDHNVRNNFRYFYTVTAFDVNSFQSGPSNLESPRITKSVTPVRPASNFENTAQLSTHVVGRNQVAMDTIITQDPTINATTGVWSGSVRPSNGLSPNFVGFVKEVIAAPGAFSVKLDSLKPGQTDISGCCGATVAPVTAVYYFTAISGSDSTRLTVPITVNSNDAGSAANAANFDAVFVDNDLASRFGGNSSFVLKGAAFDTIPSGFFTLSSTLGS